MRVKAYQSKRISLQINYDISVTGERLSDAECDEVIKDCMDPEDDDGFIPYARKYRSVFTRELWMRPTAPPRNRQRVLNHLHP